MSGTILLVMRLLMAACLYAFLGWALYLLWQELKQQGISLRRQPPPLALLYQDGEDIRPYHFILPEFTIGRDPACNCVINDTTVSAQHARLIFRQGQWWVEDLGSTNGTFLNQVPVSTPLVIASGDRLRCGQALFTITIHSPAGESASELSELS